MKCYKNKISNLYALSLASILLVSFIGNLEQAQAPPGRMGGGPHTSIGERINHFGDYALKKSIGGGKDFTFGTEGIYSGQKQKKIDLGSAKDIGFPSESRVIAEQFVERKFGTSAKDILLLKSLIAKKGLKLMENKEAFVEIIGPEHAQLHSNEPLPYLEKFINGHLLIYLNYITKNSIFNIHSNFIS